MRVNMINLSTGAIPHQEALNDAYPSPNDKLIRQITM